MSWNPAGEGTGHQEASPMSRDVDDNALTREFGVYLLNSPSISVAADSMDWGGGCPRPPPRLWMPKSTVLPASPKLGQKGSGCSTREKHRVRSGGSTVHRLLISYHTVLDTECDPAAPTVDFLTSQVHSSQG